MNIDLILSSLITERAMDNREFFAAVAVARYGLKWLLGLSKSDDDRYFKWCMAGGGIEPKESPPRAAVREMHEETNAKGRAVGPVLTDPDRPGVAFVPCIITVKPKLISKADEFVCLGLFTEQEIKKLDNVYPNVLPMIKRAKRYFR
jgi:8-oxo-dGTP pyrophosphatase MutT (NUDIX family)